MMNDTIRKLIDSCRPRGDDLRQPEMQPLADLIADDVFAAGQLERSRQLDDTITAAVQEVPTPAGLEQRLLTALADSAAVTTDKPSTLPGELPGEPSQAEDLSAGGTSVVKSDLVLRRKPGNSWSRRSWMAVATCAAVIVIVAFGISQFSGPNISYDELVSTALNWEPDEKGWKDGNLIWKSHPLPGNAFRPAKVKHRKVYTTPKYKFKTRCYDLALERGGTARVRVFVFTATSASFNLPMAPPVTPVSTRGKCVGAWTSGGLVYVLVAGSVEDYKAAIQPPSQLTLCWPVSEIFYAIGTV